MTTVNWRSTLVRACARLVLGVSLAALAALPAALPVGAATATDLGTLDRTTPVVSWSGGPFSNPGGAPGVSQPLPQSCASNCESRTLRIGFPASTWVRPGDGVIIAIHHQGFDDALNLYVYDPAGQMVGQSNGLDSDGQAVLLKHPAAGTYRIVVNASELANANVTYLGDARLHLDPCTSGNCDLLPYLHPVAPTDFHLSGLPVGPSTALGQPLPFALGPATTQSCWLDEQTAQGASRCLRLTNTIDNLGAGPLILRFQLTSPLLQPGVDPHNEYLTGCEMQQVVMRDDGSSWTRDAGPCVFHVPHGHFHYQNMATFGLHAVNADGSTGPTLRTAKKVGFCLTDVHEQAFGNPSAGSPGSAGNGGRQYWFPNCNLPSQIDANAWVRMGISAGWGDVYTWDVPQQYIEVSGVPDGLYDVVSVANPLGQILESGGHTGGQARSRVCISGSSATVVAATATGCSAASAARAAAPSSSSGGGAPSGSTRAAVTGLPNTGAGAAGGATVAVLVVLAAVVGAAWLSRRHPLRRPEV